jgi:hypothetical protein
LEKELPYGRLVVVEGVFALQILILVFVLRVSVSIGYSPIGSGAVYGVLCGLVSLLDPLPIHHAFMYGAANAFLAMIALFFLEKTDSVWYLWWPLVVASFSIPILSYVVVP